MPTTPTSMVNRLMGVESWPDAITFTGGITGPITATGSTSVIAGGSSATLLPSGNVYRRILTAANGISPSATGADKIVDGFTLPASAFDLTGRGLQVTMWGTFANNANAKRLKVLYGATLGALDGTVTVSGGTAIGDSGSITTTGGGSYILVCQLFKTGAGASNTQESITSQVQFAATPAALGTWTDATFTESASAFIALTLNCTTTASDLKHQGCEFTWFN